LTLANLFDVPPENSRAKAATDLRFVEVLAFLVTFDPNLGSIHFVQGC